MWASVQWAASQAQKRHRLATCPKMVIQWIKMITWVSWYLKWFDSFSFLSCNYFDFVCRPIRFDLFRQFGRDVYVKFTIDNCLRWMLFKFFRFIFIFIFKKVWQEYRRALNLMHSRSCIMSQHSGAQLAITSSIHVSVKLFMRHNHRSQLTVSPIRPIQKGNLRLLLSHCQRSNSTKTQ